MSPLIDELLGAMEVSYRTGRRWHLSLLASVEGVSAEQAVWTPAQGRNSIWKIVDEASFDPQHEQGGILIEGRLEMWIGEERKIMEPGDRFPSSGPPPGGPHASEVTA